VSRHLGRVVVEDAADNLLGHVPVEQPSAQGMGASRTPEEERCRRPLKVMLCERWRCAGIKPAWSGR
jgi:hypothetical protein